MKHTFGSEPCEACKSTEEHYYSSGVKTFLSHVDWENVVLVLISAVFFIGVGYSKMGDTGAVLGIFGTILFMCGFINP